MTSDNDMTKLGYGPELGMCKYVQNGNVKMVKTQMHRLDSDVDNGAEFDILSAWDANYSNMQDCTVVDQQDSGQLTSECLVNGDVDDIDEVQRYITTGGLARVVEQVQVLHKVAMAMANKALACRLLARQATCLAITMAATLMQPMANMAMEAPTAAPAACKQMRLEAMQMRGIAMLING